MPWEESLEKSEMAMLDVYVERAQIEDVMSIVDFGCGLGSMSLHLASKFLIAKLHPLAIRIRNESTL